jgi:hypothetical protein
MIRLALALAGGALFSATGRQTATSVKQMRLAAGSRVGLP